MKQTRFKLDTTIHDLIAVIRSEIRENSDIVYICDEGEFKVILPYVRGNMHNILLKRLRDRLSDEFMKDNGSCELHDRFDINVADVNVLLSKADFDYMDEPDRGRFLENNKSGSRFAIFHGIVYSIDEEAMCVSNLSH